MRRQSLAFLLVTILLTGCGVVNAPQASPAPRPGVTGTPAPDIFAEATRVQRHYEDTMATANAYSAHLTQTHEATVQAGAATQARYAAIQTETRAAITLAAAYAADTATAVATATAAARTQAAVYTIQTRESADAEAFRANQEIIIASNRLALEREQRMNVVRAVAPWVGLGALLALAIYGVYIFARTLARRPQIIRRPNGAVLVIPPEGGVLDPDRLLAPGLLPRQADYVIPVSPEVSAQQVEQNRRQQAIELARVGGATAGPVREAFTPAAPVTPEAEVVVDADWRTLDSLYQPGKVILGVNPEGPVVIDPEENPHLLYAGTTSSGKTRGGLRPLAAQALANGWQVVLIGRQRPDFRAFDGLPNARLVFIDQAEQATGYLEAVFAEIQRRNRLLYNANVSTWSRLSGCGPRVLVVIDEFSNLADEMPAESGRRGLWRALRMATAEGRKCGVHMAVALQDPTWQSMDLPTRRNMTPVIFRVHDQAASRVVLNENGAERLPKQHFLTRLQQVVHGKAFAPSDAELQEFVSRRPVMALPAPEWVALPGPQPAPGEEDLREQTVRSLLLRGWSINRICQEVYGYPGGSAYAAVVEVKRRMEAEKGTTTGITTSITTETMAGAAQRG